ncbi:MAG: phosphoribosyltransferase family protein [Micrococcaceae bacterium]|nr:phosphoribosyltransferase family protein [Micrococcaceae bacterium]
MSRKNAIIFRDRGHAGQLLGEALAARGVGSEAVVLGLLRGGVPVAAAVASHLGAELGALAVRKLGVPHQKELAFGATASYHSHTGRYLVPSVLQHALDSCLAAELVEVEIDAGAALEHLAGIFADFAPEVAGRTVVLCDDGLATGATMRAALEVLSRCQAADIIVAVPVAPRGLAGSMQGASATIVLRTPRDFTNVGSHYEDFGQVREQTVEELLRGTRTAGH